MMARPIRQGGVSLVEALVAMAVMAFGMLALVGLQGVLRSNSDVSRQRAEGVRLAQELLEDKRTFSVLAAGGAGKAFADIKDDATAPEDSATGYSSSVTFGRGLTVVDLPKAVPDTDEERYYMAPLKQLGVSVTWTDRNGENQAVALNTIISRTAPELAGALSASGAGSVAQLREGRNRAIPPGAINLTDQPGRSVFIPPNATGVVWKFDNVTGSIVETCTSVAISGSSVTASGCAAFKRHLLSGYIRYALGTTEPGSAESETPPDLGISGVTVGVMVHLNSYSDAADATPEICYAGTTSLSVYYCAVPYDEGTLTWTGRSTVTFNKCWSRTSRKDSTDPLDLDSPYRCMSSDADFFAADSALNGEATALVSTADNKPTRYRVCRYTARRDQSQVSYADPNTAPSKPWIQNFEHPRDYQNVGGSLTNQNFLIIRAGDGATPFNCPEDNLDTLVNGRTWFHQPSS